MLPRLNLRLTCDGVPVIGTVPGVFMRIPHPKPPARFLGRRPSLHPARPQPPPRRYLLTCTSWRHYQNEDPANEFRPRTASNHPSCAANLLATMMVNCLTNVWNSTCRPTWSSFFLLLLHQSSFFCLTFLSDRRGERDLAPRLLH